MRKLMLLLALSSPLAQAESLDVAAHSVLRLPNKASSVHLEQLQVADSATLLLPATLTELKVDRLVLGRDARIAITPAEAPLRIETGIAVLGEGSEISAPGAAGTYERAARPGRDLELRLNGLQAQRLSIDARGGAGAPGYVGLDGANGKAGGCTWGQASRGANGDDGGNGHDGASGGRIRLAVPDGFPAEHIQVRLDGGAPGKPGGGGQGWPGRRQQGMPCLSNRRRCGWTARCGRAAWVGGSGWGVGPAAVVSGFFWEGVRNFVFGHNMSKRCMYANQKETPA